MPSLLSPEIVENIPVVLSLILIEGLLSVDNSLAIAALASRLPEHQRPRALTWGMAGAYGFRCLCLLFASAILENRWLKLTGAAYLVYLMCKELTAEEDAELEASAATDPTTGLPAQPHVVRSYFSVIVGILFLDASLSVDNVVAAIAMTPKLWVVYLGVGIGILALRFVAGYCIKLIARFPILEETAFVLVGFVGALLIVEMELEFHVGPAGKFVGILSIVALSLAYDRVPLLHTVLSPVVGVLHLLMRAVAFAVSFAIWPLTKIAAAVAAAFRARTAKADPHVGVSLS